MMLILIFLVAWLALAILTGLLFGCLSMTGCGNDR